MPVRTGYRHKNIPDSWLKYTEVGHRIGLSCFRITAWVRHGYLRTHKVGHISYICWDEAMQSRLFRNQLEKFKKRLLREADLELPDKEHSDPLSVEHIYNEV